MSSALAPKTNSQPGHATAKNVGHVTQIIGSTFDVEFPEESLPAIYNAVMVQSDYKGVHLDLTGEVQQRVIHIFNHMRIASVPGKELQLWQFRKNVACERLKQKATLGSWAGCRFRGGVWATRGPMRAVP